MRTTSCSTLFVEASILGTASARGTRARSSNRAEHTRQRLAVVASSTAAMLGAMPRPMGGGRSITRTHRTDTTRADSDGALATLGSTETLAPSNCPLGGEPRGDEDRAHAADARLQLTPEREHGDEGVAGQAGRARAEWPLPSLANRTATRSSRCFSPMRRQSACSIVSRHLLTRFSRDRQALYLCLNFFSSNKRASG